MYGVATRYPESPTRMQLIKTNIKVQKMHLIQENETAEQKIEDNLT